MTIQLGVPDLSELRPKITVFGVGGAGGNAVNNMIKANLEGVEFVVANTDAQALAQSACERRIQMGTTITEGLGAGSRPEIGRAAAEESLGEIMDHLSGCHMIFVTAGMGGGTGTGAAPVIAQAAKDQGILTVGVVTKPFQFEGARRMRIAESGIEEFQSFADTCLIIPNQNLFRIANENTTFAQAFGMADEVLHSGVRGITDLMVMPGLINLDFADVRTVMNEMGKAMMGTGEAEGEKRAVEAAEAAISNPLLDEVSMKGARGVLINITGGLDLGLYEVDEAANRIRSEVDQEANIIVGSTFDERMEGIMRVSVVATGIDSVENVVPITEGQGQGTQTVRPMQKVWRSSGGAGQSAVLAMTQDIQEGLNVDATADTTPDTVAKAEVARQPEPPKANPIPVAEAQTTAPRQTAQSMADVVIKKAEANYAAEQAGQENNIAQTVPQAKATPRPMMTPAPRPQGQAQVQQPAAPVQQPTAQQQLATAVSEDTSEVSSSQQVEQAGQKKGKLGVFDRMMAGVKSARAANKAQQQPPKIPPTYGAQQTGQAQPVPEKATQAPQQQEAAPQPNSAEQQAQPTNEQVYSVTEEEEQLEIPAFLRRQAN